MIATANAIDFNREPSKILGAGERGITTVVDKHGLPAIAVIPTPKPTSGAELGRRLARMRPQPEAAAAVASLIKGMDEAN